MSLQNVVNILIDADVTKAKQALKNLDSDFDGTVQQVKSLDLSMEQLGQVFQRRIADLEKMGKQTGTVRRAMLEFGRDQGFTTTIDAVKRAMETLNAPISAANQAQATHIFNTRVKDFREYAASAGVTSKQIAVAMLEMESSGTRFGAKAKTAFREVAGDSDRLSRGISETYRQFGFAETGAVKAGNAIRGAGGHARTASGIFGDLAHTIRNAVGMFAIFGTYQFAKDQFGELTKVASDFQKIDHSYKMYMKTLEESDEVKKWTQELGLQTFGIRELQEAYIKLAHVGLKPTRGELEGLVGYMLSVGKTAPKTFGEAITKMTQLAQNATIGFDDAFREVTEFFPFALQAVKKTMGYEWNDIQQMSKKRVLDFATLFKSMAQYAEQNFRAGLTSASVDDMWDVLIQRFENRIELLRKLITQGDWFPELRAWIRNINAEFDELFKTGALESWANEIGQAITGLVREFTGGTPSLHSFKNAILAVIEGITTAIRSIKEIVKVLGLFLEVVGQIASAANSLGSSGLGATMAGGGILWMVLFGSSGPGTIIIVLTGILMVLNQIKESAKKAPYKPVISEAVGLEEGDAAGLMSQFKSWMNTKIGAGEISPEAEALWKQIQDTPKLEAWEPSTAVATVTQAYENDNKTLTRFDSLVKQRGVIWKDIAQSMKEEREYSAKSAQYGRLDQMELNDPGAQLFRSQYDEIEQRGKTDYDRMIEQAEVSGLTGYGRFKREQEVQYKEMQGRFKAKEDLLGRRWLQIYKLGRDPQQNTELMSLVKKQEMQRRDYENAYNRNISGEYARWWDLSKQQLDQIDQSIEDLNNSKSNAEESLQRMIEGMEASYMKPRGDTVDAAGLKSDRQTQGYIAAIKKMGQEMINKAINVQQRAWKDKQTMDIFTPGEFDTLWNNMSADIKAVEQWMKDAEAQLKEQGLIRKNLVTTIAEAQKAIDDANIDEQWQALFGDRAGIGKARGIGINQQSWLDQIQNWNDPKVKLQIGQIAAERERQNKILSDGDFLQGFSVGAWNSRLGIPTQAERGVEALNTIRDAVDGISGATAELATTGKFNFQQFAQQIIASMIKIGIQALITDRLLKMFMNLFNPGIGALNASAPGLPQRASGGPVSSGSTYLVGEEGPELFIPGSSGSIVPNKSLGGHSINTSIVVNVPIKGGGNGIDAASAQKMGEIISEAIDSRFNEKLRENMKPGGLLNRGRSY